MKLGNISVFDLVLPDFFRKFFSQISVYTPLSPRGKSRNPVNPDGTLGRELTVIRSDVVGEWRVSGCA